MSWGTWEERSDLFNQDEETAAEEYARLWADEDAMDRDADERAEEE